MTRLPYKLLDYYRFEDADLFFGREEETRKMVGEILSTRLLVLFSPSGSGKTSLIDAGVRPQLEEMGFRTVYTRMEDAPIPAICRAVSDTLQLPPCTDEEKKDLYEFIKKAAQMAGKPLVIFLDQFEEFFIIFHNQPGLRNEFIAQAAKIKYDDRLPVYLVFSLREDYFAHIHEFREAIPSIFRNNANIRLEAFDEKAARRVIENPLKTLGWTFEPGLADKIIKDLNKDGAGIEPIMLQMVCSALWDQRPKEPGEIPLSTYNACGGSKTIIGKFIEERLNKVPLMQRRLLVRVCEALKTPDNTKRYRSFEDLQSQLKDIKPRRLKPVLKQLVTLNLLREEERSGTLWYEFKHDYAAAEINRWIKERKERIQRKRLWVAGLPGLILLLALLIYFFIQLNTFYAEFSTPKYEDQRWEIKIYRGIDILDKPVLTGFFLSDVKQDERNKLGQRFKIGYWDQDDWRGLVDLLTIAKKGEFLYRIGETGESIKELESSPEVKEPDVRMRAADAPGKLGNVDETVIDALLRALNNRDFFVTQRVADTLVRLGKANRKSIEILLQALKNNDPTVREEAAESLDKLDRADQAIIDVLVNALKSKYKGVRQQATSCLVRLGKADRKVGDALLKVLQVVNEDKYARVLSAALLVQLGIEDQAVNDALSQAMTDDYLDIQQQAAASLAQLGKADQKVIEVLLKALKDKDPEVRHQAGISLVQRGIEKQKVIDAFLQGIKDEDPAIRKQAAKTMGSLGILGIADEKFIDALRQAVKDRNPGVQREAADSLGIFYKAKSEDYLLNLLKDRRSEYRTAAANGLAQKKPLSEKTLYKIIDLKNNAKHPWWVRLGAWEAYDLIRNRNELELRKKLINN